jgi:hypothetical protein
MRIKQAVARLFKFNAGNKPYTPPNKVSRDFLLKHMPQNSICAEIGVWQGSFTEEILKEVEPKELHLIDPWQFQSEFPETWFSGLIAKSQTDMDQIYQGVCKKFDHLENVIINRGFSQEVLKKFEDGYFDWIYIDGNHFYEYVKQDLELSYQKVKKGGFITGDDYHWSKNNELPVKKAVDEFIMGGKVTKIAIENDQFILKKE